MKSICMFCMIKPFLAGYVRELCLVPFSREHVSTSALTLGERRATVPTHTGNGAERGLFGGRTLPPLLTPPLWLSQGLMRSASQRSLLRVLQSTRFCKMATELHLRGLNTYFPV